MISFVVDANSFRRASTIYVHIFLTVLLFPCVGNLDFLVTDEYIKNVYIYDQFCCDGQLGANRASTV